MNYELSKKNIKQSIKNLSTFLNDQGISLPQHKLLEGMAKIFSLKIGTHLEGIATSPEQIKHMIPQKRYIIEIEINTSKEKLLEMMKASFENGKCIFNVINCHGTNEKYLIELDVTKSTNNFITALLMFGKHVKTTNYTVKRMEMCRLSCEKESLSGLFDL